MTSSVKISDRLAKCFSSVIHDVMRDEGFKNFVLNPRMYYILKFIDDKIAYWNIMRDARGNRFDHKKPKKFI